MTTGEIGLYNDMKGMYLSGASIKAIVEKYGVTLTDCTIVNTLEAIKIELTPMEIRERKLNKTKIKLCKLRGKYNILYTKELKLAERTRHFKTKQLVIEQSIQKLHACIDKLNNV